MAKTTVKSPSHRQTLQPHTPAAPWAYHHTATGSHIDAYIEKCNEWMTLATTLSNDQFDARAVAEQIVNAVNTQDHYLSVMEEMASALEACLENDRLGWSAEHDGEIILKRYRELLKARRD